jgi:hypothetical protein
MYRKKGLALDPLSMEIIVIFFCYLFKFFFGVCKVMLHETPTMKRKPQHILHCHFIK